MPSKLGAEREREQQAVPDLPAADLKCAQEEGSSAMNEWIYIYKLLLRFGAGIYLRLRRQQPASLSFIVFHSFHSSQGGSLI